jgi:short chain dehydrogenase
VAIVAGAGGALGHATTATLAASGLTAVAVDRNERGLRELPDSARTEVADTIDPAVATRLIDRIAGEVGPPDVLVNTIGALRPGDALTTTPEKLRLMIDGNLGTALWLSQAVAPHMQQQGSGVIVHVTARPGIEPSGMAAYAASKGAESRPRLPKAAGPKKRLGLGAQITQRSARIMDDAVPHPQPRRTAVISTSSTRRLTAARVLRRTHVAEEASWVRHKFEKKQRQGSWRMATS